MHINRMIAELQLCVRLANDLVARVDLREHGGKVDCFLLNQLLSLEIGR